VGGDKGIDGVARFPLGPKNQFGRILVSVKGGKHLNAGMARDLLGTVEGQKAHMGILITVEPAAKGIKDVIDHGGGFTHPSKPAKFPEAAALHHRRSIGRDAAANAADPLPYIPAGQYEAPVEHDQLPFELDDSKHVQAEHAGSGAPPDD
jgi:hypothetical protein